MAPIMFIIIFVIICGLLLLFLFLLKIQLQLSIELGSQENIFQFDGKALFGMIHFKKRYSLQQIISQILSSSDHESLKFESMIQSMNLRNQASRSFFKTIKFHRFIWQSTIGLGDAATTGIAAGILWSLKGSCFALLKNFISFQLPPRIDIKPEFQGEIFQTSLQCMVFLNAGHAIIRSYKIYKTWKSINDFAFNEEDRRSING